MYAATASFHGYAAWKGKLVRTAYVSAVLCLLALSACAYTSTQVPEVTDAELTAEQQEQLRLSAEEKMRAKHRAAKRRLAMQERLLRVYDKVSAAAVPICSRLGIEGRSCVYEIELAKPYSPLNAMADGKKIIVTPAMMRFAKDDAELAYVLGHEYAHNMMGHVSMMRKNVTIGSVVGTLLDVVAGTQGVSTGGVLSEAGAHAGVLVHSTQMEAEADYIGLYITHHAGYALDKAPAFWRRMSNRDPEGIFMSTTHPSNPERFVMLKKTIAEIEEKHHNKVDVFPKLKPETP